MTKEILRYKNQNIEMAKKQGFVEGGSEVTYDVAREAIINPEKYAQKIEPSRTEIAPGIILTSKTIEFEEGNFTNMYDLSFDNKRTDLNMKILTRQSPLYQHRLFVNAEKNLSSVLSNPIACINGAFFFLQYGNPEKLPSEIIYNLNIRDGKVYGLPSVSRPALFTRKDGGSINATEIKAKGIISIGEKNQKIHWTGGEPYSHNKKTETKLEDNEATLFNSACCTIEYEIPGDKTSIKKLRKDLNFTPKRDGFTDVIVSVNQNNELVVLNKNKGGHTDFFEGNFVLQMSDKLSDNIKIGDKVNPKTLETEHGSLEIDKIESAMTTGPMVKHFLENDDHEINHDPSLGSVPPFGNDKRYARSLIYEDKNNFVHMVIFDAVPRSNKMKGVTPKEAAERIPSDSKWAVFLDGGQSSRITFKSGESVKAVGNKQYLRFHVKKEIDGSEKKRTEDHDFLWTLNGRPMSSMIILETKK